jgi:hypothetical protein
MSQVEVAPGATVEIPLSWQSSGLSPGAHEGFLRITSSAGQEINVPYWYAASNGQPAYNPVLSSTTSGRRGALVRDAILFRITDAAGVPLRTDDIEVTAVSGDGTFDALISYDSESPGLYGVRVRLGPNAGQNRFRLRAGAVSIEFTLTGQ